MPSANLDPTSRRFNQELVSMRKDINGIQRTIRSGDLGNSALMGAAIPVFDEDGTIRGEIGIVGDSFLAQAHNGNTPSVPNTPVLEPFPVGINIKSTGFTTPTPNDTIHVEIYRLTASDQAWDHTTFIGTIPVSGGDYPDAPLDPGTYYYGFLGVNSSDRAAGTGVREHTSGKSGLASASPNQVVADDILDGIVTTVKLADNAATQAKIAAGAIGTAQFQGQSVTTASLANGAVDASKILAGAVGPNAIATDAIQADHISAGAIGTSELAANSVVAGKIAADSITSGHIVAGAIQANEIAAGAVLADKIAANAVTAGAIAALSITSDKIATNSINAGHITAGAVTAQKLAANMVIANRIIAGSATGQRVEMHPVNGIVAVNAAGQVTVWINSTGDFTAVGSHSTGFSGERAVMATDGSLYFYPASGSNYSYIANTSGGILMRGPLDSGGNSGYIFLFNGGAELRYGASSGTSYAYMNVTSTYVNFIAPAVGARVDRRRAPADGTANRFFLVTTNASGTDVAASVIHYFPRNTSDYKPVLVGANDAGILIGESAGMSGACNGNGSAWMDWTARNIYGTINPPSSETLKQEIGEIVYEQNYTSWDLIEGAPALSWQYTDEAHQTPRSAKPVGPDGKPMTLEDENGKTFEIDWTDAPRPIKTRTHKFPLAEDLLAIDPHLVDSSRGSDPSLLAVDLRDLVGVLWDAVDMLIKRNRILENKLPSSVDMPARPQKGTLTDGIGSKIPGRTKRVIDSNTGQAKKVRKGKNS